MNLIFIGFTSFLVTCLGVRVIRYWALRRNVLDIPNERSSHTIPTPRGGGLAITLCIFLGMEIWQFAQPSDDHFLNAYLAGALCIAGVSILDDLFTLPAKFRLLVHLLGALIFVGLGGGYIDQLGLSLLGTINLGWLGIPLCVLWIVGLTNAYNFMDGIDGIAAGQAIVASGFWLTIAQVYNLAPLSVLCVLQIGASLGFLVYNLPPARIFMGDIGSTWLGFTFGVLPLWAFNRTGNSHLFIVGLLFVAPFVFDAGVTLCRRMIRHENILQPHRNHLYQNLVRLGNSHGRVSVGYAFMALLCGGIGLGYLSVNDLLNLLMLGLASAILIAFIILGNVLDKKYA